MTETINREPLTHFSGIRPDTVAQLREKIKREQLEIELPFADDLRFHNPLERLVDRWQDKRTCFLEDNKEVEKVDLLYGGTGKDADVVASVFRIPKMPDLLPRLVIYGHSKRLRRKHLNTIVGLINGYLK